MKLTYNVLGITGTVIRTKTLDPLVIKLTIANGDHNKGKEMIEDYLYRKHLMADSIVLVEIDELGE